MNNPDLNNHVFILENIIPDSDQLFKLIREQTPWDTSMKSRKTYSYGIPYNYSDISYEDIPFPPYINGISNRIKEKIGYLPNNCLINYYTGWDSKMGFHSDQVELLEDGTGIAIISLGSERIMRFKNKVDKSITEDIILRPNSLFYMDKEFQDKWLHAILPGKENESSERISITLRKIITI